MKKYKGYESEKRRKIIAYVMTITTVFIALIIVALYIHMNSRTPQVTPPDTNQTDYMADFDREPYIEKYERQKKVISEKINEINERYGQELSQKLRDDAQKILQENNVEDIQGFNNMVSEIENYKNSNINWDESRSADTGWGKCRFTRGLTLSLPNPKTSKDYSRIKQGKLSIIVDANFYGSLEKDYELRNRVVFENQKRYLYKLFEGRIPENEISSIFVQMANIDDLSRGIEFTKNYNGVEYFFEYWPDTKELRILFDWN